MVKNRIILAVLIVGTGVFASFYGGNIPYALFYITLVAPVVSVLYTLYVYARFKLYQEIAGYTIVKGDVTDYSFRLANEDFITYQDMSVDFFKEFSTIRQSETFRNYCLTPGERIEMNTDMRCHFRGKYSVGAKSIVIKDFFNLFNLRYPVFSKIDVTVLPRVIHLDTLNLLPLDEDAKTSRFKLNSEKDELDIDVRHYVPGDTRRQIHWKATARKGELISRQYTERPKIGVRLCMDLSTIKIKDMVQRAAAEDKIIEAALAVGDYCIRKNIACDACFSTEEIEYAPLRTREQFDDFYHRCGEFEFTARQSVDTVLERGILTDDACVRYIVLTWEITGELYKQVAGVARRGSDVTVVLMRDKLPDEQERLRGYMTESSVMVLTIPSEEELEHAFGRKL